MNGSGEAVQGEGVGEEGVLEVMVASRAHSILIVAVLCAPLSAWAGTVVEPTLQITIEERFDDDAFLREAASDAPIAAELMTKVSPRAGVTLEQRTLDASAWYAPDLQLRYFSGTFRVDHRGGVDLRKELSRLHTLTFEGRLWRVADPTSLPRMGMARTTAPVLYGTGDLGLESQLARRWILETHYRFEGTQIFEADAPIGQVHQPYAELWYRLTPRASIGTEYRFQYFIYGDEQALAHSPVGSFRYRLNRSTTFSARGGPVFFRNLRDLQPGVAPRVQLDLARYVEGMEFGAHVGQDVLGASGFSEAVWAQYAGVYGAYRINEPLRVFAASYFFRNGYAPGSMDTWIGADDSATQGYAVGMGVEWRFNPHLMVQGQLDRIAQVGVVPGTAGQLSRNIAAIRLVVTPW